MKHRVTVAYEVITPESDHDGDFYDHGWIHPVTGFRRSLRLGGKRMYERNVRMAQSCKFDWKLSDAISFVDGQHCESFEGWANDIESLRKGFDISIKANQEYHASQYQGVTVNYEIHVSNLTGGSRDRLVEFFKSKGVRFQS